MAQEKTGESPAASDDFIPPDFDEDAFIHREMVSFRTTSILFAWGIVAALVSWAAFAGMGGAKVGWLVGLAICAVFGYTLRWIFPRLGADIKHFGRREWLGTGALFFFSWLAFFLITINPPVSDFAGPRVDLRAAPYAQEPSGVVDLHLFVEDNVKVAAHTFQFNQGASVFATEDQLTDLGHGHYVYHASGLPPGTYHLSATATDAKGHEGSGSLDFTVSEGILSYDAPGTGNTLAGLADRVLVTTGDVPACPTKKGIVQGYNPCVRTVRLEMLNSTANVTLKYAKDEKSWVATTALAGWTHGNNTFDVVAELADQYSGSTRIDGGSIREGPHTLDVQATPGTDVVTPPLDPAAHQRNVPGLGLPLTAAGLVALALVLRRKDE